MFDSKQGIKSYLVKLKGTLIWQIYLLEKVVIISIISSSCHLAFQHVTMPVFGSTKCTLALCVILTQSPLFNHIRVCFPIHLALSLQTLLNLICNVNCNAFSNSSSLSRFTTRTPYLLHENLSLFLSIVMFYQ